MDENIERFEGILTVLDQFYENLVVVVTLD